MNAKRTFAIALLLIAATSELGTARAQDYYDDTYSIEPVSYGTTYVDASPDAYVAQVGGLQEQIATVKGGVGVGPIGGCDCGVGGCDGGCDIGCDDCDVCCDPCCRPAWQFQVDLTMLRYHKTGGVAVGSDAYVGFNPEAAELGFMASPRFHLRHYGKNDMFTEVSYFEFNHSANAQDGMGSFIAVRTYTLDAVAGERFQLNRDWDVEVTAGSRIWNFSETLVDFDAGQLEYNRDNSWGIGGIVGLEARRQFHENWYWYGGARFAIVQGDHALGFSRNGGNSVANVRLTDENFIQTELFSGTEFNRVLDSGTEIFCRVGVEWLTYENATSQFNDTAPGQQNNERRVVPGADAGFGGMTISLGVYH